jgi:hypothetical protein
MKYKYLIYKIYSWTAKKRGDTPIENTILTLAIMHLFQAFVLYLSLTELLPLWDGSITLIKLMLL